MSHQTPADATASSTSTNQIRRLTNSFGLLSYQQQGSKEIRELPHVPGSTGTNVCDLVFSYKLQFCQFLGHSKCTVTYLPGNYRDAELVNENFDDFVLSLNVNDPQVDFSGDETIARSFPLAKSVLFFSRVIIRLDFAQFEPKQKDKYACRLNLVHLTSGNVTQLPESDERVFMDQMRRLSDAETAAQEKLVGKQEDCLLKTFAWNKTILVAISPRFNENNANFEVGTTNFGNRYIIKDCATFAEGSAGEHKYPGQEFSRWEFTVVNHLPGFEAPIVGIMQNRFKKDLDAYAGKTDRGVTIEPIFDDVLGDRSREGLSDFGKDLNAMNAQTLGFLTPALTTAQLPLRAMFLKGMPYVPSDNEITGPPAPAPIAWHGNDSQKEALRKAFEHKVSLVWGPAATGKSFTLAAIIVEAIRRNPKERVLANASRNVPLDSLLDRTIQEWETKNPNVDPPFVRLFSASQIQSQYLSKAAILDNPCHIDKLRLKEAAAHPRLYPAFLENHKDMMLQGFIEDDKKAKKYYKEASDLTKVVMDKAKVVFGTTAACRNKALRWEVKVGTKEDPEKVKIETWPVTINVVDEAACANPLELLLPLATFNTIKRVVYGGDHKQLPPFLASPEAVGEWATTFFQQLIERKWPYTLLNIQYRTHSDAAEAANHVIYDDKVTAYYKTNEPRPFLTGLIKNLPLPFVANDLQYKLTSYLNFVDVPNGKENGPPNGSRVNLQEVEVVIGMLRSFLSRGQGRMGRNIAVVTAYTLQFSQIQNKVREMNTKEPDKGWNQVHLLTANTVQAEEYEIVILSLVKTQDSRGFVGESPRANVVSTRHKEAMYFVGKWDFWISPSRVAKLKWLDKIIWRMRDTAGPQNLNRPQEFRIQGRPVSGVPSTARPTPRLPSSAPAPSPAPSVGPLPPPTEPASEEEEDDVNAALDEEITAARKKMLDEQDRITGEVETRVEDLQRIIAAETAKAETELIKVTKEGQEKIKALEARKRR